MSGKNMPAFDGWAQMSVSANRDSQKINYQQIVLQLNKNTMPIKNKGFFIMVRNIQQIDKQHYAPYHDSCHKMVWRKYIYPVYGIGYRTFLKYLKIKLPDELSL